MYRLVTGYRCISWLLATTVSAGSWPVMYQLQSQPLTHPSHQAQPPKATVGRERSNIPLHIAFNLKGLHVKFKNTIVYVQLKKKKIFKREKKIFEVFNSLAMSNNSGPM